MQIYVQGALQKKAMIASFVKHFTEIHYFIYLQYLHRFSVL